jgi:polysaccharide biosynthesis protein PslJ
MTAPGHLVARWSAWDRLRLPVLVIVAALAVAVGAATLPRVVEPSMTLAFALPFLAFAGVLGFLLPVQTLPSVIVLVLALVPTRLIPNDGPFNALPPLAIVLGVWVFRRLILGQQAEETRDAPDTRPVAPRFAVCAIGVLLAVWLVLSSALAGFGDTSIGWTTAFTASVLLPLLILDARAEARLLVKTLLVAGALAGSYLFVEMLLGFSPLYGGATTEFIFSVYRARGAFAHPLFAAAFLTIPAALGIGQWLTSGRRWSLVAGGLAALGVVATVSRGSIAAIGVAVGFALLIGPLFIGWRHVRRWASLLVLSAIAAVIVLNFSPLAERAGSIESAISAQVRERALEVAGLAGAQSGWIGTGPGTSGETGRLFDDIVIENSLLQLLISIGIPGIVLFLAFIGALIWAAWANRNLAVSLAVVAYIVSISGFNSLDGVRSMHIVLGILVLLAVHALPPAPIERGERA